MCHRPSLLHVIIVTSIAQLTNQSRCSLTKALHKMTKYDHENGTDVVTGGSSAERVRDLRTWTCRCSPTQVNNQGQSIVSVQCHNDWMERRSCHLSTALKHHRWYSCKCSYLRRCVTASSVFCQSSSTTRPSTQSLHIWSLGFFSRGSGCLELSVWWTAWTVVNCEQFQTVT